MLSVLVQADDHLAPALHIQLAQQAVDMCLRCCQADVQPTGDLLVTEPRRDQLGGLPFASGERECRGWRIAADAEALGDGDPVEQLGGHPTRAELLATVNAHDEAHKIGLSGGVRDIADHTRLRPGDDILFRLSYPVYNDADVRFDLAGPPGCSGTVPERRVDQHHVSLQEKLNAATSARSAHRLTTETDGSRSRNSARLSRRKRTSETITMRRASRPNGPAWRGARSSPVPNPSFRSRQGSSPCSHT